MNLILGAIREMKLEHLLLFLISLKQTGYQGRLAFYVSKIDDQTRDFLEKFPAELLEVQEDDIFTNRPVNTFRYYVYRQYLEMNPGAFDKILFTDVRDVLFQRDPFDFEMAAPLCCFLESAQRPLGDCVINAGWVAATYGKEVAEAMAPRNISCSGTTIGTAGAMLDYVKTLTDELDALEEKIPHCSYVLGGMDQSTHNYLLHQGCLPHVHLYPNEDAPVYTMNHVQPEEFHLNEAGDLVNPQGDIPLILHQFDRHDFLADHFIHKLGLDSLKK